MYVCVKTGFQLGLSSLKYLLINSFIIGNSVEFADADPGGR